MLWSVLSLIFLLNHNVACMCMAGETDGSTNQLDELLRAEICRNATRPADDILVQLQLPAHNILLCLS